ncbi:shikimate dehydrogenase [Rhodobacteraceae bacterium nBUS_24]
MTLERVPLVAVLGTPVAHSKSPLLHGFWLKKFGITGHYIPVDVKSIDLETVLHNMPKMGFVGANVTLPHKEKILSIADQISDRAALIGAANTLVFQPDGKIYADNTDGYGFIENIRQQAPNWQAKDGPALVLGAGGAARAVVSALIEAGAPEVCISNRTRSRSDQIKSDFGGRVSVVEWVKAPTEIEHAHTLVNTTSLGMTGKPALNLSLDGLKPETLVTDIVYTPIDTEFIKSARSKGCIAVDGLGMLIHQAIPGFERWFGQKPVVDQEIRDILLS